MILLCPLSKYSTVGIDIRIRASSLMEWFGFNETLKSTRRRTVFFVIATSSIYFMADDFSIAYGKNVAKRGKRGYNTLMDGQHIPESVYPLTFRQQEAKKLGAYLEQRRSVNLIGMRRVGIRLTLLRCSR